MMLKDKLKNRKGFIVVILFFLVVAIAIVVMPLIMNVVSFHAISEHERAFYIAEAGVKYYAQRVLRDDPDWTDNAGISKDFSGGSFSVIVIGPAPRERSRIVIRSTGTVAVGIHSFSRVIEQEIRVTRGAFSSALYGHTHALLEQCNNITINGDINLSGTLTMVNNNNAVINGDVNQNLPELQLPAVDWPYWQAQAQGFGSDHVKSADFSFTGNDAVYNGIYYVNGNVTISGNNAEFLGTIVATGSITITSGNSITIEPSGGKPCLVAGGNLTVGQGNNIVANGALFSVGVLTLDQANNMQISGSLVFGGGFAADHVNNALQITPSFSSGDGFIGGSTILFLRSFREI